MCIMVVMVPRMLRLAGGVVAAALIAFGPAACFPGPISVPPGGQEVHALVVGDTVRLEPTTVRAGDVYLVLDNPTTNVVLIERSDAPGESGPLTDADLDRLAHGDTGHMKITGGFANGEPYGNVSRLELVSGRYAFLADAPELLAARFGGVIPPESLAVLSVLP
jgi:hypothetical protein